MLILKSMLVLLGVPTLVYSQETVKFHNVSDNPVFIAVAYSKDESIAGLGNSGYTDPNPFTYTEGYFKIQGKDFYEVPRRKEVEAYGKKMKAGLVAIRVVAAKGREEEVIRPDSKANPRIFPIYDRSGESNFSWVVRSTSPNEIERIIRSMSDDGKKVTGGDFYYLASWENTQSNGKWLGVGRANSRTGNQILSFWENHYEDAGTRINITNRTGKKYEFRLSFESTNGEWLTYNDTVDVRNGETTTYNLRREFRIAKNSEGFQIKVEGKDFDDRKLTWGPPINPGSKYILKNGERVLELNINLNP